MHEICYQITVGPSGAISQSLSSGASASLSVPISSAIGHQAANSFSHPLNPFGQQPTSFGQQPTSFGQQPASFGQQPTSFGQQPTSFGQQPTSFGQQPASFSQQPTCKLRIEKSLVHLIEPLYCRFCYYVLSKYACKPSFYTRVSPLAQRRQLRNPQVLPRRTQRRKNRRKRKGKKIQHRMISAHRHNSLNDPSCLLIPVSPRSPVSPFPTSFTNPIVPLPIPH